MALSAQIHRPTFGVRLLALLIDYALVLGWMALLAISTLTLYAITGEFFNWLVLGTAGAQLLGFLLLMLPVSVYLYAGEASARQATVGRRALGLHVVHVVDGGRPLRTRILVRTVVKLLPWEIDHFAAWNIVAVTTTGNTSFPPVAHGHRRIQRSTAPRLRCGRRISKGPARPSRSCCGHAGGARAQDEYLTDWKAIAYAFQHGKQRDSG